MNMTAQELCGALVRVIGIWFLWQFVFAAYSFGIQTFVSEQPQPPQAMTLGGIYLGIQLVLGLFLAFGGSSIARCLYRRG